MRVYQAQRSKNQHAVARTSGTPFQSGGQPSAGKKTLVERHAPSHYASPVDQLLTYGEGYSVPPECWPNYLALGLGPEHVCDLIRMATDAALQFAASDSLEVWAPLHAWRALGQLRAEPAVEPLLSLFDHLDESDWALEELPLVFGLIGRAVLPPLAAYLADGLHEVEAHLCAIPGVQQIGRRWPDARPACVEFLVKHLERCAQQDPEMNGFLVAGLVDLYAIEATPLIERAFVSRRVDPTVIGDWGEVQVRLGLLSPEVASSSGFS